MKMAGRKTIFTVWSLVLFAAIGVGAGHAASGLNPQTARAKFVKNLSHDFGPGFMNAGHVWVECPRAEILEIDGERKASCMAEFRAHTTMSFVTASVDSSLKVKWYSFARWHRASRRCEPSYLNRLGVNGVLATNDRRCSTASLMASDLEYKARTGRLGRKTTVGWHGTNLLGFERVATYKCLSKRKGSAFHIRCRNALGDTFRLRLNAQG